MQLGFSIAKLRRRAIQGGGLLAFTRLSWSLVEAGIFQENWHHHIICEALEAVSKGELRKVVICVPPGSTKTLLTGVMWPAWDWIDHPERRLLHTTYGDSLATKAARQMKLLVEEPWFVELTEGRVIIPKEETHAVKWFKNNCKGERFSGSVNGEVTGRHAHIIVGDDLNKSKDASTPSTTTFDRSWTFWSDDLRTRQADPKTTARVLIGQRLHRDDVPGRWMDSDPEVYRIILPMRGAPARATCHSKDTRAEGELFWPGRFDEAELQELAAMSPSAQAAQLEQDPIPPGGQLIKSEYLENRYSTKPVWLQRLLGGQVVPGVTCGVYGDCTFKGKPKNDFTVYQLWVAYQREYWLIDQVRGQWGFTEAKQRLRDFVQAWPCARFTKLEDAANAPALEDDIKAMGREIQGLQLLPVSGGCLARQQLVEGIWASGAVHLPDDAPWMGGGAGFIAEHLSYDGLGTRHDDQVSVSGLALLDLSGGSAASYTNAWAAVLKAGKNV